MKKNVLFSILALFFAGILNAQSFFDDFESYSDGAYPSKTNTRWSTWSNAPGGADDSKVSTEKAFSGTKSLKFSSTVAAGGPADVLLFFDAAKATLDRGLLDFNFQIYVVKGTAGYFNFQAKSPVGTTWALDCYLTPEGRLATTNGSASGVNVDVAYEQDKWNKLGFKLNLTLNVWEVYLNDVKVGSYNAPTNSVYAVDFYPVNGAAPNLSTYYIDDVKIDYTAPTPKELDLALLNVGLKAKSIPGKTLPISAIFRNIGTTKIDSVDINWTDGVNNITQRVKGLNLASFASYTYTFPEKYSVNPANTNVTITATPLGAVNDKDLTNNTINKKVTVVIPAAGKKFVAEEVTGTWCAWCPRGHVYMNNMDAEYHDYFVGIAAHGGSATEPMLLSEYVTGVFTFPGITGYPGCVFDRKSEGDPLALEDAFFDNIAIAPKATMKNVVTYNKTTNKMDIDVRTTFKENLSGDYKLVVVITEDSIKGTTAAYNQSNAYANNAAGVMGGFEKLPNPVSYTKMWYRHVARQLLTEWGGDAGSLPSNIVANTENSYKVSADIPTTYRIPYLKVISFVVNPDGSIENATETDASDFLSGVEAISEHPAFGGVSPNPTSNESFIELNLSSSMDVAVTLTDISGKIIAEKEYGSLNGDQLLPVNTQGLGNGIYLVQIRLGNELLTKKLVVNK